MICGRQQHGGDVFAGGRAATIAFGKPFVAIPHIHAMGGVPRSRVHYGGNDIPADFQGFHMIGTR